MKRIYVVFDTSAIFSGKKASAARFSQKVTKFLQNRGLLVSSRKYFVNLLINISEIFSGNVQVLDPKILVCKIFIFVNTHFFLVLEPWRATRMIVPSKYHWSTSKTAVSSKNHRYFGRFWPIFKSAASAAKFRKVDKKKSHAATFWKDDNSAALSSPGSMDRSRCICLEQRSHLDFAYVLIFVTLTNRYNFTLV